MALICLFAGFIIFVALGMPVAFSMIFSTVIYALISGVDIGLLGLQMFTALDSFILIAIPLFILTSEVMNHTSIADRLFNFIQSLVGFISGGLGHANVLISVVFSGMSGSAVADVGGVGHLSHQAMVRHGYDPYFSAAVTASSAVIGPIIPPSIPVIIYAMVANVSVAKLFFGGAVPGLLMALLLMAYIFAVSRRRGYPVTPRTAPAVILTLFIQSILPLLTPIILLGGIYLGIVTITEASALAVLYSLIIGAVAYRLTGPRQLFDCLKKVFTLCGGILILLPAAKVFGFALTAENVPFLFADFLTGLTENRVMLLIIINLIFIVLGFFSDPNVNIMLFVPMVLPLVNIIGVDPIHFGVMIVVNVMIGTVTPPVGVLLFTISALEKLEMEKVAWAILPFIAILLLVLIAVAAIPQLVLFLPETLWGG